MKKSIYSKGYNELTHWLKQGRIKQGWTIRELADKLNLNHPIVWNIENCERRLDIIEYIEYCKILELEPKSGIDIIQTTHSC